LRELLFILTICIIFSGCVEEKNANQSNESIYKGSVNLKPENLSSLTLSPEAENIPEIEVRSFSSIYTHTNLEKEDEYLFCWDNVPGSGNQELLKYLKKIKEKETPDGLKDGLNIVGQNHALIVKSADNKTIRVYFTSRNNTELTPEDREKIVLKTSYDIELELREVNGNHKVLITPQNVELEGKEVNGKLCIYKVEEKPRYNITEKYYAAYDLSIKNNDSKSLDFKLSDLYVSDGNHIFNATTIEPASPYPFDDKILIEDITLFPGQTITLFPGQTISGSVIFQVGSLYNESFLLMYNGTPISSASFKKSIKALRTAEHYNYSIAFGIPPYTDYSPLNTSRDLFEPKPESYPEIFAQWVNRKVFEFFNKYDSKSVLNSSSDYINKTETTYALKVIPERNVTMLPKTRSSEYCLLVVDDTGEELLNRSSFNRMAIFRNESYNYYTDSSYFPQMNFSNVTIVRISYWNIFNTLRLSRIYQDVILDDKLNITVAVYEGGTFIW